MKENQRVNHDFGERLLRLILPSAEHRPLLSGNKGLHLCKTSHNQT